MRKLLADHKLPQPNIIAYPYHNQRYNYNLINCNPSILEALNQEKPIIANLLIDHFGQSFIIGKLLRMPTIEIPCSIHVFKLCFTPGNFNHSNTGTTKSQPVTNAVTSSVKSHTSTTIFSEVYRN